MSQPLKDVKNQTSRVMNVPAGEETQEGTNSLQSYKESHSNRESTPITAFNRAKSIRNHSHTIRACQTVKARCDYYLRDLITST